MIFGNNNLLEMLKEVSKPLWIIKKTEPKYASKVCERCKGVEIIGHNDCPDCKGKGYITEVVNDRKTSK